MTSHDAMLADGSRSREQLQAEVPDVVLAAAVFQPNALGRSELGSLRGLQHRQLLKGEARYLGERLLVGVTPLEVCITVLWWRRVPSPWARWRWPRAEVLCSPVRTWGTDLRSGVAAVRLERADGRPIADVRPVEVGGESDEVIHLLLEHRAG